MKDVILEFRDIWKTYGMENTKSEALNGISFSLKKNSLNLILGPSGSGKTTLLNIASLMDTPSKGTVFLNGNNTSNLSESKRGKIRRRKIGTVHQRENLFHYLNILENAMLPMISPSKERALEILKSVNIIDYHKFPSEISIEDQQRVSIARAMINNPSLILADEPTGELNAEATETVMNILMDIKHKNTVLVVSNNPDLVHYADNLFSIKDGKLKM